MGIKWFWWFGTRQPAATQTDLEIAAADANAGRSFDELAAGLVRLAADRTTPEPALRALATLRPHSWLRLDYKLRYWTYWLAADKQPRQITKVALAGSDPLALLLTACSWDGHLRQRAVRTPLMRRDQRLLAVLLIRTADWAKPVRDDARSALDEALDAADAAGLVQAVGVAIALRQWRRGDYAVEAMTEALRTRSDGTLDAARSSDDVQVRRLAYQIWVERADSDALMQAALTERDIVCHRLCAQTVVRTAVRDRQRETMERLLTSRLAHVRVEALTGLVQIGQQDAGEAFLADRSAMVRSTAQWAMRRAGRDPAERYRVMLEATHDSRCPGAVAGLGECGTADDGQLLAGYLQHDSPRVRAEAVRAVRRLGGGLGQIAEMLTDPAPVVVREVATAVRGRPDLVPAELLWQLLGTDQPRHVRLAAFRLLIARDTWTRIEADLRLVVDDDLGAGARSDLALWLDSGAVTAYEVPPASNRDRLGQLIDAAEPHIGTGRTRLLRWHLDVSR